MTSANLYDYYVWNPGNDLIELANVLQIFLTVTLYCWGAYVDILEVYIIWVHEQ